MRRLVLIPALIVVLAVAWAASSSAETRQIGNIRVTFTANFTPNVLPRLQPAPVDVAIQGKVATTDGSHPPPLRWIEVKLNRNGRIDSSGLPICTAPSLQSTSTETALARCGGARVGSGRFRAEVTLGRPIAVAGRIFAFNSRRGGKQALLLHFFAGAPVRFTLVVPLTIGHRRDGEFGTVLRARVPKLGGDLGSVTEIDLTIGRRYSSGGKRRSYVSAACSTPRGIDSALFPFARGTFRFEAHREFSETLLRGCRVAGTG
ncbi:MAG TPA: hypothetical protein VFN92_06385 [Solirubrobacterales bacterium]|nr:hypothetical protein [Solirubrobacterales bacterium]